MSSADNEVNEVNNLEPIVEENNNQEVANVEDQQQEQQEEQQQEEQEQQEEQPISLPAKRRRLSLVLEDQDGMRTVILNRATITTDVNIPNPNEALFKSAYAQVQKMENLKKVSVASILVLVATCTRIVQNLKRDNTIPLSKEEKKAIVINLVQKWVDDNDQLSDEDKLYLNGIFIPTMLDGAIDSLCDLDMHNIKQCCLLQ